MTRKRVIWIVAVLAVLVLTGISQAGMGSGMGRGMGYRADSGQMPHSGAATIGPGTKFHEETAKLRSDLHSKRLEMKGLLTQPQIDENKVTALQGEISKLQTEMAQKRLAAIIEYKKTNPDWQPGANSGRGRGMMKGQGFGPGTYNQ